MANEFNEEMYQAASREASTIISTMPGVDFLSGDFFHGSSRLLHYLYEYKMSNKDKSPDFPLLDEIGRILQEEESGGITPKQFEDLTKKHAHLKTVPEGAWFWLSSRWPSLFEEKAISDPVTYEFVKGSSSYVEAPSLGVNTLKYQTTRTKFAVSKVGEYCSPEDIANLALDELRKRRGVIVDAVLLFTRHCGKPSEKDRKLSLQYPGCENHSFYRVGSFPARELAEITNNLTAFYEKQGTRFHKIPYFAGVLQLNGQTNKGAIQLFPPILFGRNLATRVQVTSPDESYVDSIFERAKTISHESYQAEKKRMEKSKKVGD